MKYFIIVASHDHVKKGVQEGFAQANHGKKSQLARMEKGDWVIYYSSKETPEGKPCQKFTSIGTVTDNEPYQGIMSSEFQPWRRDIDYRNCREVEVKPLLDDLTFIQNKQKWGFPFMRGFLEINQQDFELIAGKMLGK